eukprot:1142975-Pelagomonas_calceolata.AAC.1
MHNSCRGPVGAGNSSKPCVLCPVGVATVPNPVAIDEVHPSRKFLQGKAGDSDCSTTKEQQAHILRSVTKVLDSKATNEAHPQEDILLQKKSPTGSCSGQQATLRSMVCFRWTCGAEQAMLHWGAGQAMLHCGAVQALMHWMVCFGWFCGAGQATLEVCVGCVALTGGSGFRQLRTQGMETRL